MKSLRGSATSRSGPLQDPRGGLTAAGRAAYARKDGAHLRPGVKGPADTPDKMRRKGSFLRRHYANPRGPMRDANGNPTRLALAAHAWGEPVPRTLAAARALARKGAALLERYRKIGAAATDGANTSITRSTAIVTPKKASKRKAPSTKNSLVANINRRKKAGTSRSKADSTVSDAAYARMRAGWPKNARKPKSG